MTPELENQIRQMIRQERESSKAEQEARFREILRQELANIFKSDRFIFDKTIQIIDGNDFQFGRTTGTKFGTAADQKVSFYGITPVAQQTGVAVTAGGIHAALVSLGLITA